MSNVAAKSKIISMYMEEFAHLHEIYEELDGVCTMNQIRYITSSFSDAREEKKRDMIKNLIERAIKLPEICLKVRKSAASVRRIVEELGMTRKWEYSGGWGVSLVLPYFEDPEPALTALAKKMGLPPGGHLFTSIGKTCTVLVPGAKLKKGPVKDAGGFTKITKSELGIAYVRAGNLEALSLLIQDGFSPKDARYAGDRTLLFFARSPETVKYLLDTCGLDVYHEDRYRKTAYQHLIANRHTESAELVRSFMTSEEF